MKTFVRTLIILISLSLNLSCSGIKNSAVERKADVQLKTSVVTCASGGIFIMVDVTGEWTVALDFLGKEPWATLGVTSGKGKRVDVDMYYKENTDKENDRQLKVVVSYGGGTIARDFTQYSMTSSDRVTGWMELPEVNLTENQYFFYHTQELASRKNIRSWSYLFDACHLVSHWVAYPLNKEMIGNGSRTDMWGLDPKLPRNLQPVLLTPYSDGSYHRGHQLPSADRLNKEANIATFYGTNMTPQKGSLNSGVWASLEGKVRNWSASFDTLYVVTGCTIKGSTGTVKDNDGKNVTIPSGYFKALLGYSASKSVGITPQTGGYTGIAFYMDHFNYPSASELMNASMTIRELEKKTGFNFFVNLPVKITETLSEKVETTKDTFWK